MNFSSNTIKNIVLKSSFGSKGNGFNFAHFNPGSLLSNFDEFKSIINNVPLDLIGISESWLKEKHGDHLISISDYNIIRKDRSGRRAGGVLLYINKGIKYKIIKKNATSSKFDMVFAELSNDNFEKLLVGVVYIPPKVKSLNNLKQFLIDIVTKYNDILILGDFNCNLRCNSPYVLRFKAFLNSIGLNPASSEPTNFINGSSTCIDLLLIKNQAKLGFYTQLAVPELYT